MRQDIRQALESYRVLGLEVGAPALEVRRAYLHLMKRWHPDVRPGVSAEDKARRINRAFEILTSFNPERLRARHRSRRPAPEKSSPRPRRRPSRRWRSEHQGTPRTGGVVRPGRNLAGRIVISPEEAMRGAHWKLQSSTCSACGGWGAAADQPFAPCTTCHHLGFDPQAHLSPHQPCKDCGGRGCHFERACGRCGGTGASSVYEVRLTLPPRAKTAWWTIRGLGHPGMGGAPPGDLFVLLEVRRP